ncbi:Superkiller protein 3 [Agyrium rufum]|nr:Superkiller protein 3 [Agyrium rufum]
MASSKAALKAAKAAIDSGKYDVAITEARKVLELDQQNYHANVFLGLAYSKEGEDERSEKAYVSATKLKPSDRLAWQGLVSLYEKLEARKLDEYRDVALELARIFEKADDAEQCQIVANKCVEFTKKNGTRTQYRKALDLYLPSSPIYSFMEGRFWKPAYTYGLIVEIVEAEEKETINKEIGNRRTRLGAKIGQVTTEVKREVYERSDLEHLYSCIVDWTADDDLRRLYEEKIFQRAYELLSVLPASRKAEKRAQVQKLAEGLVILKHPNSLAWQIVLEWKDVEELGELETGILRTYFELFPSDGLSKILKAWVTSEISPFPGVTFDEEKDEKDDGEDSTATLGSDERLLVMMEGADESSRSVLSQRIIGAYYLHLEEYSSVVEIARKTQSLITNETNISGLPLQNIRDSVDVLLATALVHYQSPRHHKEATTILEGILARKPENTAALISTGLILEEEEEYAAAVDFLTRASKDNSTPRLKAEKAWCIALNGDLEKGKADLESCLDAMDAKDIKSKGLRAQTLYRVGMCLWNLDTSKSARKTRDGAYARFLASLQADLNFAPSYTMLGIYYSDYARDKSRARKCFQKAFELSPSEVEAAERLARAFADQQEWDLVEIVAQRVLDSEKVRPPPGSKKKAHSWPFAALGVVQLNNQEYSKSIVSFQSTLRLSPDDYHSWVGLGESYHNSGRYVAATRAFEQAQKVEAASDTNKLGDIWFSNYMLANVHRELSEYELAISGYRSVLESKPQEYGVSIALLQAFVESAWKNVQLGFYGAAAKNAQESFIIAKDMVQIRPSAFNLWKAVGDASSIFSWITGYGVEFPAKSVNALLHHEIDAIVFDTLADFDDVSSKSLTKVSNDENIDISPPPWMTAAILAHKRAIHTCADDIHAQAVAWYNLGWTEYRMHECCVQISDEADNKHLKFIKASVRCFKRAIELEASNAEFWNALGIVTTQLNPKVAQHSFIRSLYLNERSAIVWTNLGTLYLLQNENQLANDAFTRAQSADPDYTHAWIGQGILATLLGEKKEALGLFNHAFEIADSSSIIAKQQYSLSIFDHLQSSSSQSQTTNVLQPLLALTQLRAQMFPNNVFQHLSSLFAERAGDHTSSISTLTTLCSSLEAEFEVSESPIPLTRFAQAKSDLARAYLVLHDYSLAAENAETALDLSSDPDSGSPDPAAWDTYRLSAHITAGLAYHYLSDHDQAISMFRSALEETDGNPDTIVVLAQVLWAKGGEIERTVAKEQLFEALEKTPGYLGAVSVLGAIAVSEDDMETMEAVRDDLQGMRTKDDLSMEEKGRVARLLEVLALVMGKTQDLGDKTEENHSERYEAQTSIMVAPSEPQSWTQLAEVTNDEYAATMAVKTALKAVKTQHDAVDAEALAKAYAGTGRYADAQVAVMMTPWKKAGWEALG